MYYTGQLAPMDEEAAGLPWKLAKKLTAKEAKDLIGCNPNLKQINSSWF